MCFADHSKPLFQWHKRSLYSWISPDGQHQNKIDHIFTWRWRSSIQSAKIRPGADCWLDHQQLIVKFRIKLKKVGENYSTIQVWPKSKSHDTAFDTAEVMNRCKGLDLVDRVPEKLWTEICNIVQEVVTKTFPKKKKWKNVKWLSEKALQIAEKRREVKG